MRILTLGAGTVGTWIADLLCRHRHDVIVVDTDAEVVRRVNNDLDVRAIHGSASQSSVLFQAGVMTCDVCLAVTGSDEVNIVAASMAKAMGGNRSVARVYAPVFRDLSTFDYQRHFQIDRLLSLEHLTAMELARAIRSPESITLEHFARGQLEVAEFEVTRGGERLNVPLKQIQLSSHARFGTLRRDGRTWIASANDAIQIGDRVSLIGRTRDVDEIKREYTEPESRGQFIAIAGGGETGYHLARALDHKRYRVLVIDHHPDRCAFLAAHLTHATVVCADAMRRLTLEEERVGGSHYFVACMGNDENNIMACLEAKDLGAQESMAIVGRPDYAQLVGRLGIDRAVSERDAMARQILGLLTEGPLLSQLQLPDSDVHVLELEVQPDAAISRGTLADTSLPEGVLVAAVLEEDYVSVPAASDQLHPGNLALVLAPSERIESVREAFLTPEGT